MTRYNIPTIRNIQLETAFGGSYLMLDSRSPIGVEDKFRGNDTLRYSVTMVYATLIGLLDG